MIIEEQYIPMKDGRKALLRSPREEDAPALLEYLRATSGETEFLMRYPEETAGMSVADEQAFVHRAVASPDTAMLVCLVDGVLAGNCQIVFNSRIKTRHRASIAIAILRKYWGLGLGTEMLNALIRLAEARDGLTQLELEFIEGNERARRLYEKVGFRILGIHPNAVRLKDGRLLNEYLMIREIARN